MSKATNEIVEIYRQRYETFRHLDKLRWQMLQLLIAIGSATAIGLRFTKGTPEWWFCLLLGVALVLLAIVMHRISTGIRKNGRVLKTVGKAVGDTEIPDVSNSMKSIAHWLMLAVAIVGTLLIVFSVKMVAEKYGYISCG
ncbi:MAG: hypothetical protein OXE84_14615 [Rhodobacteraceae bacterium]|nr:hypothetical protein [Paracoccaceae bacterium]MCY4328058.1 hypothetical protein [Paracoccaceae bacterium]